MNGIITAVFTVIYHMCTIWLCKGYKLKLRDMATGGLVCALTVLLSCIYIPLPTGGSFTLGACVPIIVLALVADYRLAIITGWISGVLCLLLVPAWQPVHWAQMFAEHLVCFSCLAYVGIWNKNGKVHILVMTAVALAIKLLGHIMSGVAFFSSFAWDGWGTWGYSIAYNLSIWAPELIITLLIVAFLPIKVIKRITNKGV